ncbi:MAG: hypothetical protein ACE5HC_15100, partial [Candidatus Binatia bacterium]
PGRIVCDILFRRKARGLLLSGSMVAITTILLELDPFFMLPDPIGLSCTIVPNFAGGNSKEAIKNGL